MSKERLLNVARALRECQLPTHFFTMRTWGHRAREVNTCGTPACAMGHYAVRSDLQDVFTLNRDGELVSTENPSYGLGLFAAADHFSISHEEAEELFGPSGCNGARSRSYAATYIEEFAERKWPTPPLVIDGPTTLVQAEAPVPVKAKVDERELVYV